MELPLEVFTALTGLERVVFERTDSDARNHGRAFIGRKIDLKCLDADGRAVRRRVIARDISRSGIAVVSDTALAAGEEFVALFALDTGAIELRCEIVRCVSAGPSARAHLVGAKFLAFVDNRKTRARQAPAASPPGPASEETPEVRRIRDAMFGNDSDPA
jgi:hypothetical protein